MDKSDFFADKKYFVQADGQGISIFKVTNKIHHLKTQNSIILAVLNFNRQFREGPNFGKWAELAKNLSKIRKFSSERLTVFNKHKGGKLCIRQQGCSRLMVWGAKGPGWPRTPRL